MGRKASCPSPACSCPAPQGRANLVVFLLAVLLVFPVLAALYESWALPAGTAKPASVRPRMVPRQRSPAGPGYAHTSHSGQVRQRGARGRQVSLPSCTIRAWYSL